MKRGRLYVLAYVGALVLVPGVAAWVPCWQWARPARNEFVVQEGGLVRDQGALPGISSTSVVVERHKKEE
jgi:hypothetical protein